MKRFLRLVIIVWFFNGTGLLAQTNVLVNALCPDGLNSEDYQLGNNEIMIVEVSVSNQDYNSVQITQNGVRDFNIGIPRSSNFLGAYDPSPNHRYVRIDVPSLDEGNQKALYDLLEQRITGVFPQFSHTVGQGWLSDEEFGYLYLSQDANALQLDIMNLEASLVSTRMLGSLGMDVSLIQRARYGHPGDESFIFSLISPTYKLFLYLYEGCA